MIPHLTQAELYERFKALHAEGFIMPNAWDGGSAVILFDAGFRALGTSSSALATSLGRLDGRGAVSRDEHLAHAKVMIDVTGLPVNGDLEDGFGREPDDVEQTVKAAIETGLAGVGIQDTTTDPKRPIHDFDKAVARMKAAGKAAKGRIMLTGRTDNFLHARLDLDDTIRRLTAFAEVGADVLYAPGLPDLNAIEAVVRAVAPLPVNVMIGPTGGTVSWPTLQQAGVKRLSLGPELYARTIWHAYDAGIELLSGDIARSVGRIPQATSSNGFEVIRKKMRLATGQWND